MKTFHYILSGNLTVSVVANHQGEAEEKLQTYLEDNSPLRDWEITEVKTGEQDGRADIDLTQEDI